MILRIKWKNIFMEFEWVPRDDDIFVNDQTSVVEIYRQLDKMSDTPLDKMDEQFQAEFTYYACALYMLGDTNVIKIE